MSGEKSSSHGSIDALLLHTLRDRGLHICSSFIGREERKRERTQKGKERDLKERGCAMRSHQITASSHVRWYSVFHNFLMRTMRIGKQLLKTFISI